MGYVKKDAMTSLVSCSADFFPDPIDISKWLYMYCLYSIISIVFNYLLTREVCSSRSNVFSDKQ